MNGVHWQGRWDPFRELQREMGRLLEGLDPFQPLRNVRQYPPINVYDAGDGYILSPSLPGHRSRRTSSSRSPARP